MDWFKDLASSIRSTSLERINSPVTGAFAFTWFFWNWKPVLLIVFGDGKFEQRLSDASHLIGFFSGFILPVISTAAISFCLPRINKVVSESQQAPNFATMEMAFKKRKQTLQWDIELEKLSAQSSLAFEEEKASLELMIAQSKQEADKALAEMKASQSMLLALQQNLNNSESEISDLKGQVDMKDQTIQDLKEFQDGYTEILKQLEDERIAHEKTRQDLASAHSQNKGLYIELQEYKTR